MTTLKTAAKETKFLVALWIEGPPGVWVCHGFDSRRAKSCFITLNDIMHFISVAFQTVMSV